MRWLVAAALVASLSTSVWADKAAARVHYEASKKHFDLGEWDAAIAALRAAHKEHPDPAYLFNIAQAQRLKGDCLAAFDQYESFLRESNASEEQQGYARQLADELAPCAQRRRSEIAEARRIAALPIPVARQRRGLRIAGWAALGTGLLAGGASALFLARSDRASDRVGRALAQQPLVWTDELEADERVGKRDQALGIGCAIGGGALLIGGAAMWWLGRSRIEMVVVEPRPGGATGGVAWRW